MQAAAKFQKRVTRDQLKEEKKMRNGKQQVIQGVRPSATLTSAWRKGISLFCLVLAAVVASPAQDRQALTTAKTAAAQAARIRAGIAIPRANVLGTFIEFGQTYQALAQPVIKAPTHWLLTPQEPSRETTLTQAPSATASCVQVMA
jgi:hypothetical protein